MLPRQKQKSNGGLTQFMRKLGTGYTNYFNKKYERVGGLFQGNFKAISVAKGNYLNYLLYYIHFNPLDLFEPGWRTEKINNSQRAIEFLDSYRWSSHLDYLGKKNFPSVTQREFMLKILGGEKNYRESIENWLKKITTKKDNKELKLVSLGISTIGS
jgi:putative transposase